MKYIISISLLCIFVGCKTYYMSPHVIGYVKYQNTGVENVSIQFINEEKVLSMKDGTFEIPTKKEQSKTAPNLQIIREMNSPLIIFQKQGFKNDTIDIRDYNYESSIYKLDTVNVGSIDIEPISRPK